MKTSELKMRIKQLGYYLGTYDTHVEVWVGYAGSTPCAKIWNARIGACEINTGNIELIKLCLEYAETPISDREDEKKYIVVLPDPESEGSSFALARTVNETIVINVAKKSNIETLKRYRLTEAEIKRNHEYLWQFAKEVQE